MLGTNKPFSGQLDQYESDRRTASPKILSKGPLRWQAISGGKRRICERPYGRLHSLRRLAHRSQYLLRSGAHQGTPETGNGRGHVGSSSMPGPRVCRTSLVVSVSLDTVPNSRHGQRTEDQREP
jgi:hypothetical protein